MEDKDDYIFLRGKMPSLRKGTWMSPPWQTGGLWTHSGIPREWHHPIGWSFHSRNTTSLPLTLTKKISKPFSHSNGSWSPWGGSSALLCLGLKWKLLKNNACFSLSLLVWTLFSECGSLGSPKSANSGSYGQPLILLVLQGSNIP